MLFSINAVVTSPFLKLPLTTSGTTHRKFDVV